MKKILRLSLLLCFVLSAAAAFSQGPNDTGTYYSNADGKTGAALKTALGSIIVKHVQRTYKDLWTDFRSTDARPDGKVWDMYSNITNYVFGTDQAGSYKYEGDVYNREHSFPKSWFNDEYPMYTDLLHLYPTDAKVNGMRSNHPFGEVGNVSWESSGSFSKLGDAKSGMGYSGTVFEPNDMYKGDFARTYFYMLTCYETYTSNNVKRSITSWNCPMLDGKVYPGFSDWALKLLLRWSEQDPVSEKELKRNEAVYQIQQNRNPYIDYPGLEQYVWGSKVGQPFRYDGSTGISDVAAGHAAQPQTVYDLSGRRIQGRHQLRRGIYVKGGKKHVVR